MLKVVGASWLQTRISTYILVAVALLGLGAIILGEFGRVENDGTYAATVTWKHNGGYRIDFWGQGNDLHAIPPGAARAYYTTRIHHTGWSVIEIESSEEYPDTVQAYSAGLLEGSLTWQLIHHHWHNTIGEPCAKRESACEEIRQQLRDNSAYNRERANLLGADQPYWHMVRLFYNQLDGMEAGWRFAVRRSRQSVEIESEDFLWLAMASDLPYHENNAGESATSAAFTGTMLLKMLAKGDNGDPLIALAHNTAAPYAKMLRLLKRYNLGYHLSPSKGSQLVPGRSIVMASYPGALSSQDEYYAVQGTGRELLVAGTLLTIDDRGARSRASYKDQVTLAARVMSANRLATDGHSWSKFLYLNSAGTASRQWLAIDPRLSSVWLIEQLPGITYAVDHSKDLAGNGYVVCTGAPMTKDVKKIAGAIRVSAVDRSAEVSRRQANLTTPVEVGHLMRGHVPEGKDDTTENSTAASGLDLLDIIAFRGDIGSAPFPAGVIDTKILTAGLDGVASFQATSGPSYRDGIPAFNWSRTFPNEPHCGHPEIFNFHAVTPQWVWI